MVGMMKVARNTALLEFRDEMAIGQSGTVGKFGAGRGIHDLALPGFFGCIFTAGPAVLPAVVSTR